MIEEGMSKEPPAGGVPEIDAKGMFAPGFNNISAIMIRLTQGPTAYRDPALSRSNVKKSTEIKSGQVSRAGSKEVSPDPEQSRAGTPGDKEGDKEGDEVVQ
jgi:hypothetical protein